MRRIFDTGTVPGDGVHIVWPLLLGPNRGRYFLLTGQRTLGDRSARARCRRRGTAPGELLDRLAIARDLARQPDMALPLRPLVHDAVDQATMVDDLGFGLALEGLGAYQSWPSEPTIRSGDERD
jgi:enoyl-CoA hydratase/carnithine racemase